MELQVTGNASYRHTRTGILAVQAVEAPEVVAARRRVGAVGRQHGKFVMSSGLFGSLEGLVAELKAAKPSLVLGGGSGANATALAVAAAEINKALGNVGQTIKPAEGSQAWDGVASHAAIRDAAERMAARQAGRGLAARGQHRQRGRAQRARPASVSSPRAHARK